MIINANYLIGPSMIYTISGIILGTLGGTVIANARRADFRFTSYDIPSGWLVVTMGGIIGGAIGFGIGITKICNGTYPY